MSSLMTGVLNELKSENQRLENELIFINKCLNVLFKFKTNLFEIFNSKTSSETICLTSKDIQLFKDIDEEYNRVLAEKWIKSESNEELFENNKNIDNNCETLVMNEHNYVQPFEAINNNKELNEYQKKPHLTSNGISIPINRSIASQQMVTKPMIIISNPKPVIPTVILPSITPQTIFNHFSKEINSNMLILKVQKCQTNQTLNNSNKTFGQTNDGILNSSSVQISNKCNIDSNTNLIDNRIYYNILKDCKMYSRYNCPVDGCKYECQIKGEYWHHLKNNHKDYQPIKCEFCDKRFQNNREKYRHKSNVHSEKRFKCDSVGCEQSFKKIFHLYTHQLIHKNDKPFKCDVNQCKYSAKSKLRLTAHKRVTHSNERPFICKFNGCLAKFKTKNQLSVHSNRHNSINLRLKCGFEGCDKECRNETSLKRHLESHSDKTLSCDWPGCQYVTNIGSNLTNHKKSHSNERNFLCDWPECRKAFRCKEYLECHLRVHTNEKPYSCLWPGCDYRCATLSNLNVHKRVHIKK